ncbi:MAG TPA: Lrp/AsnC ligand binding domain-containing protein [Thermomicrobiaceae bacterium]|nr:Lrp/AsnC ligand binding domain-containing protein [Thermomicrobiaceae bacterium]
MPKCRPCWPVCRGTSPGCLHDQGVRPDHRRDWQGDEVHDTLEHIAGVAEVSVVAGTYDVVVVITASDAREIGRIVMGEIQRIDGVRSTVTLVAIR